VRSIRTIRPWPPFDSAQGPPFDSAQGPPFDSAQGPPFDSAQRPPFDSAQGPPFDSAQGPPFDSAQGPPFDSAQGPPFDSAQGPPKPPGPDVISEMDRCFSIGGESESTRHRHLSAASPAWQGYCFRNHSSEGFLHDVIGSESCRAPPRHVETLRATSLLRVLRCSRDHGDGVCEHRE
jgi:hypothetical protein